MNNDLFSRSDLGSLTSVKRAELKETLGLTGSEVSFNNLPAGTAIPFVHSHKRNEEVYLFIRGKGEFWIDGTIIPVREGSTVRVSPAAKRCIRATEDLGYFCVQTDNGSLVQYTKTDGIINDDKPEWK